QRPRRPAPRPRRARPPRPRPRQRHDGLRAAEGVMALLEDVRAAELDGLRRWFPPGARVLELGGGSGFQARPLASWGCAVRSIDLAGGRPWAERYFDVEPYDGVHIPAADGAFDVVFSSNVLLAVPVDRLPALVAETRRVLAPGGVAVHVLPSTAWRVWTNVT